MWWVVLLLKPLAVLVVSFVYWLIVYRGSHWLDRFIPAGKLKAALFRERGD